MKRNLFGMSIVAMVGIVSIFCSCGNKGSLSQTQAVADSVVVESLGIDTVAAKEFIESMYKDLYEPFKLYDERRYEKSQGVSA